MGILSGILGKKATEVKAVIDDVGTELTLAVVTADGNKMVATLIDLANAAESPAAGDLITDVAFAMQALYDNFAKDPRDIEVSRNFIKYQAPRSVELVKGYITALSSGTCSKEERADVEETLGKVIESFKQYLAKCLENDSTGLEFQSKSLDRLLQLQAVAPVQPAQS